jgi:hypothetical protein
MTEKCGQFKLDHFRREEFSRRKALVKVPSLSKYFDGDPIIEVQSLTGSEVFLAEHRSQANQGIEEFIKALNNSSMRVKVEAALEAMGINSEATPELIKAVAYVELGTVSVKFTQSDLIKMAENKVVDFWRLYKKISSLSDMGSIPVGELSATGATLE